METNILTTEELFGEKDNHILTSEELFKPKEEDKQNFAPPLTGNTQATQTTTPTPTLNQPLQDTQKITAQPAKTPDMPKSQALQEKLQYNKQQEDTKISWLAGITKMSDEKKNARAQVAYNMNKQIGIPLDSAYEHLEDYSAALGIRGVPTTEEFTDTLWKFPVAAGLLTNPIVTGIGILKFMAITELDNMFVSGLSKKIDYKFGANKGAQDLLSDETKPVIKDLAATVDLIARGYALGKVDKGFGALWKVATGNAIEHYNLPLNTEKLEQNVAKEPAKTKQEAMLDLQQEIVKINKGKKTKAGTTRLKIAEKQLEQMKGVTVENKPKTPTISTKGATVEKQSDGTYQIVFKDGTMSKSVYQNKVDAETVLESMQGVKPESIKLTHFSTTPELEEIDSEKMGTGAMGAEKNRVFEDYEKGKLTEGSERTSDWYSEKSRVEKQVVSKYTYETDIEKSKLYNMDKDEQNFRTKDGRIDETAIKKAGFKGYLMKVDGQTQARMFGKTKATYLGKSEAKGKFDSGKTASEIKASRVEQSTKEYFTNKNVTVISAEKGDTVSQERTDILKKELSKEISGEVSGVYDGNPVETSQVVEGLDPHKARFLGAKYNQESILTDKGLVYVTGKNKGKIRPRDTSKPILTGAKARKEEFYSVWTKPNGSKVAIAIPLVEEGKFEIDKNALTITEEEAARVEYVKMLGKIINKIGKKAVTAIKGEIEQLQENDINFLAKQIKNQKLKDTVKKMYTDKVLLEGKALGKFGGQQATTKPITNIEKGTPKVSLTAVGKAIENKIFEDYGHLAEYTKKTVRNQSLLAQNLMSNMDNARACLRGEKPLPEGLHGSSLISAFDAYIYNQQPKNAGELVLEIANSPYATGISTAAQEMRFAAEIDPLSPVKAVKSINKAVDTWNKEAPRKSILRTKVTLEQSNKITALSNRAIKARKAMRASTPAKGNKRSPQQWEYGLSVAAFEDYITTLNNNASHQTVMQNIKSGKGFGILGNLSKSIVSSFDNSFIGRQGEMQLLKAFGGNVEAGKIWGKTLVKSFDVMIKTFKNKPVMQTLKAWQISDPEYPLIKEMNISLGQREEEFPIHSGLHKVPILGKVYKATENAYLASASYMRFQIAKSLIRQAKNAGATLDKPQLIGLGSIANMATGRISKQNTPSTTNAFLWAPNLMKSNMHVLTGQLFDKNITTPFARKQAAKSSLQMIVGAGVIMGIAEIVSPGSIESDPRSSDFGKLKVGDKRIDFTGGKAAYVTLASRIAMGIAGKHAFKSSTTGIIEKTTGEGFNEKTALDIGIQFLENKTSPTAGVVIDWLRNKTFEKEKPTLGHSIKALTVPLTPRQIAENINEPTADQLLLGISEAFGFSSSKYSTDIDWNNSNSKELKTFKETVGDKEFNEANDEYNTMVKDWITEVKENPRWIELDEETKMTLYRAKQSEFKNRVYKMFGFKYRPSKSMPLPKF